MSQKLLKKILYNLCLYFSYINYSQIAAKLVRQALKPEFRAEALKRDETNIKFTQWKDGKPASKYIIFILFNYFISISFYDYIFNFLYIKLKKYIINMRLCLF